jgi:hypothetical protein
LSDRTDDFFALGFGRLEAGFRSASAEVLRQFGVLAEGPIGSNGAFETTPVLAIVAAMTSGSAAFLAAPW